jgi:plastocyanin
MAVVFATALALVGCGTDDDAISSSTAGTTSPTTSAPAEPLPVPVQHLDVDGTEYAFTYDPAPSESPLQAGWTSVRFANLGGEAHQIMFARLKDGVDLGELAAAGAGDSSGAAAIEFVDMIGGVSYIGPGQEIEALVDLPEGIVMAMCYVPDGAGVAHALHGMSTVLNVGPAPVPPTTATSNAPSVDVVDTIRMTDEGYEIPDLSTAGWYRVVNDDVGAAGTGLHELAILRVDRELDDDAATEVVEALAVNETPDVQLDALGGLGAISAGFEGYLYLDLDDGDYLAVDFMPDARDPRPHLLDGYWATFRV